MQTPEQEFEEKRQAVNDWLAGLPEVDAVTEERLPIAGERPAVALNLAQEQVDRLWAKNEAHVGQGGNGLPGEVFSAEEAEARLAAIFGKPKPFSGKPRSFPV